MTTEEFQTEVLAILKRIEATLIEIRYPQSDMYPTIGPIGQQQPSGQYQQFAGDPEWLRQPGRIASENPQK